MKRLVNAPYICIVCRGRDSGTGVGTPDRIGWFCATCGPDRARIIHFMDKKTLDAFERRILDRVRTQLQDGDLDVPATEIVPFLEWLITTYGEEIRKELDNGGPPF